MSEHPEEQIADYWRAQDSLEIARLKGLCARAAEALSQADWSGDHGERFALLRELREAAK